MKLLAISEHYYPRVGGTVNYVHETLCALAARGVETELLVPGPAPEQWLPAGMNTPPYSVRWIDADYPPIGDPSREQRYDFCNKVGIYIDKSLEGDNPPDILHILFGLFAMEMINTDELRNKGLPCIATVHNIPPLECRQVLPNAPLANRIKEAVRISAVTLKNRIRLKKYDYNLYIVPSQQVYDLLSSVVRGNVEVIGHGETTDLQALMSPPSSRCPNGLVRLLTVGGYAPHKRQHIIPKTASLLRAANIDFAWDVVGPSGRVKNYFMNIEREIIELELQDYITLHKSVPFPNLGKLYDKANIYVQPSIEEGFCLTALDAAIAGLPVIGTSAGALPDITELSGGFLVESEPESIFEAIRTCLNSESWKDVSLQAVNIRDNFSWPGAADILLQKYNELLKLDII